jgi:hypothetical protein
MEILLNKSLNTTENITTTGSTLSYKNGYYLNSETGRGDLTTEFNVQEFIANQNNSDIVSGFLDYVKNNFNQKQILEIKNNNLSLSESVNSYYNTIYRNNVLASNLIKPSPKYSSETVSYKVDIFNSQNQFSQVSKYGTKYVSTADSYYVDLIIEESTQFINDPKKEIAKTRNSGLTQVKNVAYIEKVYINNNPVTRRNVSLSNEPYVLLNGYVYPNLKTSPFADFSTNGIDFDVTNFGGKLVYEIDAEISGNTSFTETIEPKGVTNILLGNSKTFTFRTTSPNKQIERVVVDGQIVEYDRYNNESKSLVGQYTFKNVNKNHKIVVFFI